MELAPFDFPAQGYVSDCQLAPVSISKKAQGRLEACTNQKLGSTLEDKRPPPPPQIKA